MRTTLEIDDDVIAAAKELARLKGQGVGRAISDLARRGLVPDFSPNIEMQDGIPVWVHKAAAIPVTSELIRSLADDE